MMGRDQVGHGGGLVGEGALAVEGRALRQDGIHDRGGQGADGGQLRLAVRTVADGIVEADGDAGPGAELAGAAGDVVGRQPEDGAVGHGGDGLA
ncbi:MAG: hypothetical protein BWZ02_03366 [Lentisphaerae bacterium ADurb.BinA184]|nr:MAG: hypothetical protein BWZ02_03366 [Lentisphaerae bacterium ADurb.BinA184]